MKPNIKIRACDISDLEVIEELEFLHLACFPEWSAPMPIWSGYWWIATDKGLPVGFAGMINSDQGSNNGYLYRFGVIPSHRGLGLQRRLTGVVERKARKLGMGYLVTDTNRNPPSANSLIRCGYQTYNPQKPWSFATAVYWRKKITDRKCQEPS